MLHKLILVVSLTLMVSADIQRPEKLVDMSYQFNNRTIYWPTLKPFKLIVGFRNWTNKGYWYEGNDYESAEHGGTHMDAPAHFFKGKWRMDDIPPQNFFAEGVVMDLKEKAKQNPNAQVSVQDLVAWEKEHGMIPPKSIVIMNSGWQKRWPDKARYLGTTTIDTSKLAFPGFHEDAVTWLAVNRLAIGLGVDTPSIDHGKSKNRNAHVAASMRNIYVLENVANLDDIPVKGSLIFALPMKIADGSGAPCRVYSLTKVAKPNHVVDMTYPFDEKTIYWPTSKPFKLTIRNRNQSSEGYWFEINDIEAAEHGGTHIDAPAHFYKGKWRVHDIPLERFIAEGIVIDFKEQASRNASAELHIDDLKRWETKHGMIPAKSIVFINSGWQSRWPDKERYLGTATKDTTKLKFPGFHPTAAEWLAVYRKVYGIGVDTPSIDHGPSTHFGSHVAAFKYNVYGLENVANLDKLPVRGSTIYAMPNKITDGSGAPCRIISTWPMNVNAGPQTTASVWLNLLAIVLGYLFVTKN